MVRSRFHCAPGSKAAKLISKLIVQRLDAATDNNIAALDREPLDPCAPPYIVFTPKFLPSLLLTDSQITHTHDTVVGTKLVETQAAGVASGTS